MRRQTCRCRCLLSMICCSCTRCRVHGDGVWVFCVCANFPSCVSPRYRCRCSQFFVLIVFSFFVPSLGVCGLFVSLVLLPWCVVAVHAPCVDQGARSVFGGVIMSLACIGSSALFTLSICPLVDALAFSLYPSGSPGWLQRILAQGSCQIDHAIDDLQGPEAFDTAMVMVEFESGKTAVIDVCRQAPYG